MPIELTDETALLLSRPGEVRIEDVSGLVAGLLVDVAPAVSDDGVSKRVGLGGVATLERGVVAVAVAVAVVLAVVVL